MNELFLCSWRFKVFYIFTFRTVPSSNGIGPSWNLLHNHEGIACGWSSVKYFSCLFIFCNNKQENMGDIQTTFSRFLCLNLEKKSSVAKKSKIFFEKKSIITKIKSINIFYTRSIICLLHCIHSTFLLIIIIFCLFTTFFFQYFVVQKNWKLEKSRPRTFMWIVEDIKEKKMLI